MYTLIFFFFFSSRRRHTRCSRDWSSDVCSSDLETYVKRLTQLEQIASEFAGVEKVFAIQAGREVRVVVTPNVIDDGKASELSEQIARKIERELQYPGQIKVVVIRETRAVDFAR